MASSEIDDCIEGHVPLRILHLPASLHFALNMLPTLRPVARPLFRVVNANSRSFVSTVLLSKSWDNETVADLRKELKKRGLTSWVIKFPSRHHDHPNRDIGRGTNPLSLPVSLSTMSISSVVPWPPHRAMSEKRHPFRGPRTFPVFQTSLPLHPTLAPAIWQQSCQT